MFIRIGTEVQTGVSFLVDEQVRVIDLRVWQRVEESKLKLLVKETKAL